MSDTVNNNPEPAIPAPVPIERLIDDVLGVQWRTPGAPIEINIRESRIGRAITNLVIALRTNDDDERRTAIARANVLTAALALEDVP
jgi:hypothetical protein